MWRAGQSSGVDPDQTVIDSVQAHPVRYFQAIGVQPQDSYGFVPNQQWDGPVGWVMAYRDSDVTRAGRAAPGSAPPQPTIVIDRLYPHLREHGLVHEVDHFLGAYREHVGLRAADTYGLLPLGVGMSIKRHNIWQTWHVVYRERPEYAERRAAYATWMGDPEAWPPPQVIKGPGDPGPAPPAEFGTAKVRYFDLPRASAFGTPGEGLPQAVMDALVQTGVTAERVFAICPDYRHRQLRVAYLNS